MWIILQQDFQKWVPFSLHLWQWIWNLLPFNCGAGRTQKINKYKFEHLKKFLKIDFSANQFFIYELHLMIYLNSDANIIIITIILWDRAWNFASTLLDVFGPFMCLFQIENWFWTWSLFNGSLFLLSACQGGENSTILNLSFESLSTPKEGLVLVEAWRSRGCGKEKNNICVKSLANTTNK